MSYSTMLFDTLQYAKKLTAAGFTMQQAEAQAEGIKELIDDNLTTKQDLKELEFCVKRDLKELELRMTIKFSCIVFSGISVLVILMKLFKL